MFGKGNQDCGVFLVVDFSFYFQLFFFKSIKFNIAMLEFESPFSKVILNRSKGFFFFIFIISLFERENQTIERWRWIN